MCSGVVIACKETNFVGLEIKYGLVVFLFKEYPQQGDQIGQNFAIWKTFFSRMCPKLAMR
jgi:hypothetical protein